jgi:hypothetical protein
VAPAGGDVEVVVGGFVVLGLEVAGGVDELVVDGVGEGDGVEEVDVEVFGELPFEEQEVVSSPADPRAATEARTAT